MPPRYITKYRETYLELWVVTGTRCLSRYKMNLTKSCDLHFSVSFQVLQHPVAVLQGCPCNHSKSLHHLQPFHLRHHPQQVQVNYSNQCHSIVLSWEPSFITSNYLVIKKWSLSLVVCLWLRTSSGWLWQRISPAFAFCLRLLERNASPPPSVSRLSGTPSSADSPRHQGLTSLQPPVIWWYVKLYFLTS